jgi:probable F420-dependent oxidoreductase
MSPFFNPGPIDRPRIPIYIAGVNTGLANLAGEVADGFVVHPFHSPHYLREVIVPALEAGARKSGRLRADIAVFVTVFIATTPEEREFARQQIAFYASTPSYRPVMALHGWKAAAERLSSLASHGRWSEMPALIGDHMLEVFATVADPADLPGLLKERYAGLADRLALYLPFLPGERDRFWKAFLYGWQVSE